MLERLEHTRCRHSPPVAVGEPLERYNVPVEPRKRTLRIRLEPGPKHLERGPVVLLIDAGPTSRERLRRRIRLPGLVDALGADKQPRRHKERGALQRTRVARTERAHFELLLPGTA